MQDEGLRPDGAAYVAAMEACARGGVMDRALSILDRVLTLHPGDERVREYMYKTYYICNESVVTTRTSALQTAQKIAFTISVVERGLRP